MSTDIFLQGGSYGWCGSPYQTNEWLNQVQATIQESISTFLNAATLVEQIPVRKPNGDVQFSYHLVCRSTVSDETLNHLRETIQNVITCEENLEAFLVEEKDIFDVPRMVPPNYPFLVIGRKRYTLHARERLHYPERTERRWSI